MRKVRLNFDHTNSTGKMFAGQTVELPDEEAEWVIRVTGAIRVDLEQRGKEILEGNNNVRPERPESTLAS